MKRGRPGRYGGEAGALYISCPGAIALTDPTKADDACKVMLEEIFVAR
ncbi:MAG: hypothetical protein ACLU9S_01850 [Oscillospiraceae bacterium]